MKRSDMTWTHEGETYIIRNVPCFEEIGMDFLEPETSEIVSLLAYLMMNGHVRKDVDYTEVEDLEQRKEDAN